MSFSGRLDTSSLKYLIGWFSLGLFLLCVYLLTGSQQYDLDVLGELKAINRLDLSSPDPAHMLYIRMGVPFYRLWLALGYSGDALRPMQILNAFFGAGTILLFGLTLRYFIGQWTPILLASLGLGLSYAFWTHTVDAFFIIPASFFSLLALVSALGLSLSYSTVRRILFTFLLGIGLSLAALSYQTNLALIPALLAASYPTESKRLPSYLWSWVIVVAILVLLAGGAWLWQGIYCAHVQSVTELINWFLFGHGGMRYGLWRREGVNLLTTIPEAWLATILPVYEGLRLRSLLAGVVTGDRLPSQFALVAFGIICFYSVLLASLQRTMFWKTVTQKRALLICSLWFTMPGVLVAWFDPAEIKLWLLPMFAWWVMLAIILTIPLLHDRLKKFQKVPILVAAGFVVLTGIGNFLVPVWPNHINPSWMMATARESMSHLTYQDLLISAGFDWTAYIGYFSDQYKVLNAINYAQSYGKAAVRPFVFERITETWKQGGHVYILDYFSSGKEDVWRNWITPLTLLSSEDFSIFSRRVAWHIGNEIVWEILPQW